jgi:hypothetical protein
MVDPRDSVVAKSLHSVLIHLEDWRFEEGCPWVLLRWLGVDGADPIEVQTFARRLLVRLSCGVFRRCEVRLSALQYKLQWLLSDNTTEADKRHLCKMLVEADGHCLTQFLRHFRTVCPTAEEVLGPKGVQLTRTWQSALTFATDEVEREKRQLSASSKEPRPREAPQCCREF